MITSIYSQLFIIIFFSTIIYSQWQKQEFPSDEKLRKVSFIDSLNGWISGENYLYHTSDGGYTWKVKDTVTFAQAIYVFNTERMIYGSSVYIKQTYDSGKTWYFMDEDPNSYYMDIAFIDSNIGFAVGASVGNGIVKKTIDGGMSWETVYNQDLGDNGFDFVGISCFDDSLLWIVSNNGQVYLSNDQGNSWNFQDTVGYKRGQSRIPIRDLIFTSADTGFAVGGISLQSVISKTVDGGRSWTEIIPQSFETEQVNASLYGIDMLNSFEGWIVGQFYDTYPVYFTEDGGLTWNKQDVAPAYIRFNSISIINKKLGWIVGDEGNVYKMDLNKITDIKSNAKISTDYILFHNYPNPFNPSTTISYVIPAAVKGERAKVKLIVYDILGRQMANLVNEEQKPGKYEVEFDPLSDGLNLSSGIYYYKLTVGNFSATKKMILIK